MRLKVYLIGGASLIVLGLVAFFAWHGAALDKAKMDAMLQAQATIIQQASQDRLQHQQDDARRDKETADTLAAMQQAISRLKTPEQHIAFDQAALETVIKGIQITLNPKTGEAQAVIPAAGIPQMTAEIEKCRECEVKLTTAQVDLASRAEQIKQADIQIKAEQNKTEAAVKAVKGTFWTRMATRGKWAAIGGGVTIVVACALGHCPR